MNWIEGMGSAVDYIENHLLEELPPEDIAAQAHVSSFYFQRAFALLCGITVGEYIRLRRLTLAGSELRATDTKVIDIAMKYGYDSPDSFGKAFVRFHGVTPSAVRKEGATARSYAPLKIKFTLEGGFIMDYKIVEKESFTIMGVARMFRNETGMAEIPKFWDEHYKTGKGEIVCGMYGVCIESADKSNEFEYLIADNYLPWKDIPDGFVCRTIPKHTWAVFPCKGAMPLALQNVNKQIYSEWLPNSRDYEIAGGYDIEMYSPASDYKNGTQDENYYCEIWVPVRKKV